MNRRVIFSISSAAWVRSARLSPAAARISGALAAWLPSSAVTISFNRSMVDSAGAAAGAAARQSSISCRNERATMLADRLNNARLSRGRHRMPRHASASGLRTSRPRSKTRSMSPTLRRLVRSSPASVCTMVFPTACSAASSVAGGSMFARISPRAPATKYPLTASKSLISLSRLSRLIVSACPSRNRHGAASPDLGLGGGNLARQGPSPRRAPMHVLRASRRISNGAMRIARSAVCPYPDRGRRALPSTQLLPASDNE
jgi:hypothetical protein